MPQDQQTGAAANAWGRDTARTIARRIGASDLSTTSNECSLGGRRVVIKTARAATTSVGVTYAMIDRLDDVVGAFQRPDGAFELWSLPAARFKDHMRDTRSHSAAGRVGLVSRDVFRSRGSSMGTLRD
jgi:hypothetical protein